MPLAPQGGEGGEVRPVRLVELSLGEPLAAMLRRWTGHVTDAAATAEALVLLRRHLQPGRIAPFPDVID